MLSATRPRSGARWAGAAVALVGLVLLGWAGWQFWGTTWVSRAHQEQIVKQLEENWAAASGPTDPSRPRPTPAADSKADPPATGSPTDVATAGTTAAAILRIPAFGSDWAVPILEGTTPEILAVGVGHFVDSAAPGGVGNYALAAHRVTHGEPFRNMPDLVAGDQIIIDTARWRYTYVLDTDGDALEVDLHDTWVTAPAPHNPTGGIGPITGPAEGPGQRLITLTTCAELFHTDERLVAFGHLANRAAR